MGEDGGDSKIYNESGGKTIKDKRKITVEPIEKEKIYVYGIIEILVKKISEEIVKNSEI